MKKILAIALDAAEPSLIEKWTQDNTLPTLSKLMEQGLFGRLASSADWMSGSTWPTFYTGKNPVNHGFYNYLVWDAEKMATEAPNPERIPLQPFWRHLKDKNGPYVIAIDIPLTYNPKPFNGREIIGFATHDMLIPATGYPQEFADSIRKKYGSELLSSERYGRQTLKEYTQTWDELIEVTEKMGSLCTDMIQQNDWDLFITSFSALHRGGHRLWGHHNVDKDISTEDVQKYADALRQIYIKCDQQIGRMIEATRPDVDVMVFSLHGMGDNSNCTDILPEMLRRIIHNEGPSASAPRPGLLGRLRESIPHELRHHLKETLPLGIRHKLTAFWRKNPGAWDKTPAFSMMADVQGWIRINLKGRERLGIVNPGEEYDNLCGKIEDGLYTYVDVDTGKPIIENIIRTHQKFEGTKIDMLPDLIIQWDDYPVHKRRAVHSPQFGSIRMPMPGYNADGRSGNHLPQGMLIAAGKSFKSGKINNGHILDLAPTILAMLDQQIPSEMEGRILPIFKEIH